MAGCNEANCKCPDVDCVNHGKCCDCVNNHLAKGNLPQCMRKAEQESGK